ncbi:hypothetical protein [Micromonospora sp. DT47]|uniref:hypothetical protein n=1 Tax=Micromonospora sp. DT47 TaxID=3393431 RepID=UPI003CF6D572
MIDMRDVGVCVLAGELASEELPMIAAQALANGLDSPSLRELAGLSRGEYREARELLDQVIDELGLPELPDEDRAVWEVARSYARRTVFGAIAPVDGAHAIASHAGSLMFPEPLATFAFLTDLWQDNVGERAQLEQDIVREAEALLREAARRQREPRSESVPHTKASRRVRQDRDR